MRLTGVLVVVSMISTGCQLSGPSEISQAHASAIQDSVQTFLATWSVEEGAESWDSLLDRYAEDPEFVWLENGRVAYRSLDEIGAAVGGLEASFDGEMTEFIEPSITPLAPGIANVTTRFQTTLIQGEDADIQYSGAMSMTVINTEEGWKVLQGHTSSEPPGQ